MIVSGAAALTLTGLTAGTAVAAEPSTRRKIDQTKSRQPNRMLRDPGAL